MGRSLFSFIIFFCCLVTSLRAQDLSLNNACKRYESRNQVDYELRVAQIKGQVLDGYNAPMGESCLSIFTEKTHELIATLTADDNGFFKFKKMPRGQYRLVVRDSGNHYCPANAKIKIVIIRLRRNSLAVRLVGQAIDVCSEINYKK